MLPVDINKPTYRWENFNEEDNTAELGISANLIEVVRELAQIQEFVAKQRAEKVYNTKVRPKRIE